MPTWSAAFNCVCVCWRVGIFSSTWSVNDCLRLSACLRVIGKYKWIIVRSACSLTLGRWNPSSTSVLRHATLCDGYAALRLFPRNLLDQIAKGRIGIAFHVKGNDKERDQIVGIDVILGPLGNLAEIIFRRELLDFHTDDFSKPGRQLLRHDPLVGRKLQAYERNLQCPVDPFGRRTENYPAQSHEHHDGSDQYVNGTDHRSVKNPELNLIHPSRDSGRRFA